MHSPDGLLAVHCLRYLRMHRPSAFVLENVASLQDSRHKDRQETSNPTFMQTLGGSSETTDKTCPSSKQAQSCAYDVHMIYGQPARLFA